MIVSTKNWWTLCSYINYLGSMWSGWTLTVKLLLAPKKQGIVTSFRSIKKKRKESNDTVGYALFTVGNDYETVQVPERKTVTFGVDLAKLEEWLVGQEK